MPSSPVYQGASRAGLAFLRLNTRTIPRHRPRWPPCVVSSSTFITLRHAAAPFSHNTRTKPSSSPKIAYTIVAVSLLATLAFTKSGPHRLESLEPDQGVPVHQANRRYGPTTIPIGIETAEQILYWNQRVQPMPSVGNVLRYDTVCIPSNPDVEDYAFIATGTDEGNLRWFFSGIFDGHLGWQTASALETHLPDYLVRNVHAALPPGTSAFSDIDSQALDQALKTAFLELDSDLMAEATAALLEPRYLNDAIPALASAYAGSCALVSYYNSDTNILKVACTGDSRAVLGRRNAAGEFQAIALSEDQTGRNEAEVARLQKEHPNEPEMIKKGRVLGMAVTRAFGDSQWKWSRELQEEARDRFFGPRIREPLLTPPYLTAEPVVTTTEIKPEKGDFLIMASDGLWDELTSEQAVDLVGRWLKTYDPSKGATPPDLAKTGSGDVLTPAGTVKQERPQAKRSYTNLGRLQEKDYIVRDENCAVHLARNALGGRDEDRLCGILTAQPPLSRDLRDDITVHVIFFGDDPNVTIDVRHL